MPCPRETIVILFFNLTNSFHLLYLFFDFSSILLVRFFCFLRRKKIVQSSKNPDEGYVLNGYEEVSLNHPYASNCIKEDEDEDPGFFTIECTGNIDFVNVVKDQVLVEDDLDLEEPEFEDTKEDFPKEELLKDEDDLNECCLTTPEHHEFHLSPILEDPEENSSGSNDEIFQEEYLHKETKFDQNIEKNLSQNEKFFIFAPPQFVPPKLEVEENDTYEISGDLFTDGSTSKSSSQWRSSILNRDSVSGTEDPFSSSSRRSCPTWESYTVFRKYDEEMIFFDRINAQKLNEADLLSSAKVCPGSISQRIVHKLTTKTKRTSGVGSNPYQELESAYVAQICLTWEALNWNYKNFQRVRASRREDDLGYPGKIAQQFQQFQVLLQRFIENEPYEHGRRPQVYARMRISAAKLLQVPEFRDLYFWVSKDSEDDQIEDDLKMKVSAIKFRIIMEDAIQTFMNFLKADRGKHCQIIYDFFKRNRRISTDPTFLHLMKKTNKKKKMKLKDLRRARNCIRKAKLKEEEEMEILIGLIDLKVVSRVLRMSNISEEQLQWCQEKMSKLRLWEGKLQRDSSPLFFPAH
ncbi:hypothetical protein GIB67_012657 [Kingdonia uniflora]|uniref:Ribosomal protein L34Ae n=1 Tax=Kingdonia uniflora TaxID=39325 RepID=A0A7J7NFI5_9MAGN|nr:hypothetical protein GIB67_012657 [Kingdonia uniflora]